MVYPIKSKGNRYYIYKKKDDANKDGNYIKLKVNDETKKIYN